MTETTLAKRRRRFSPVQVCAAVYGLVFTATLWHFYRARQISRSRSTSSWMPDGDAVNSLDVFEMYLWFVTRGDECINCPSRGQADSFLVHAADHPGEAARAGRRKTERGRGQTVDCDQLLSALTTS